VDHQIPPELNDSMIGLSDNQLQIIISTALPLAEEKCQEFLAGVAAVLQVRGQIDDDDVSAAVQLALRDLIHNSEVWKEWRWNSLRQDEPRFGAPLAGPPAALTTWTRRLFDGLVQSVAWSSHLLGGGSVGKNSRV
jgi:hypothetical protein